MNRYKWNQLNHKEDLLCVVDLKTEEIVLRNNLFQEIEEGTGVPALDATFAAENLQQPWQSMMDFLIQNPTQEYRAVETRLVMERWVDLTVVGGYFDDDCTEVYVAIKGFGSVLEFIRFQRAIDKIPEGIVLLEFNNDLSIYGTNTAFEAVFSGIDVTFESAFAGSFAAAMDSQHKDDYMSVIKINIANTGHCDMPMQLKTADGGAHFVFFNAALMQGILNHSLLCVTIQVSDENIGTFMRLLEENEVYRATAKYSNSVAFRLDLDTLQSKFYGHLTDNFNLNSGAEPFTSYVKRNNLVHAEDVDTFKEMIESMRHGLERQYHLRLRAKDGRNDWYLIEYTLSRNERNCPTTAMGRITNIQKTKDLQDKANMDSLTGCMNKGTFESLSAALFLNNPHVKSAFLIIDIDNFKAVNDNLGHLFGDMVLKEIVVKLRSVFRDKDFIGRIGGDEFVVLMQDVENPDVVERKAREVVSALDMTYKGNGTFYRVTASVGAAISPQQGKFYQELYNNADMALYYAKNQGKNDFALYNETMGKGTMVNKTPINMAKRAMAAHFDQDMAVAAFNLLFENDANSVDAVLALLGQRFGVDRCYVFEQRGHQTYDNTYEWCANGIQPQMDFLTAVPLDAFKEIFDESDEDNIYYCNDIDTIKADATRESLAVQGIQSVVITFVKRSDQVCYVLGFDDCASKRIWKPVELSTLAYVSRLIAQYLRYHTTPTQLKSEE